jgi:hypothetical protein
MVSITHFEDMPVQDIYDSLDLNWRVSEKLDGSFMEFGLDDQGVFYTKRKGGLPCYHVDDWPEECWATTYRLAHHVAEQVVEALVVENAIAAGQNLGAEIIRGYMPNCIPYVLSKEANLLMITAVNYAVPPSFYSVAKDFRCQFHSETRMSLDGDSDVMPMMHNIWLVDINHQIDKDLVKARLGQYAKRLKTILDIWFPRASAIEGFTNREVLEINLGKKHPNTGSRKWAELRPALKFEREQLQEIFRGMILMFKDTAIRVLVHQQPSTVGVGSFKEGAVVVHDGKMFKLVDRDMFTSANKFVHMIQYWLIGGSRPARPSFMSRTKDWSVEKRLDRLDVLRKRYLAKRFILHYSLEIGGKQFPILYSSELHQRTLNCFSDTKKRIESGR